jgi:hypothetical protein
MALSMTAIDMRIEKSAAKWSYTTCPPMVNTPRLLPMSYHCPTAVTRDTPPTRTVRTGYSPGRDRFGRTAEMASSSRPPIDRTSTGRMLRYSTWICSELAAEQRPFTPDPPVWMEQPPAGAT